MRVRAHHSQIRVILQNRALATVDAFTATWVGAVAGLAATLPFAPSAMIELGGASVGDIATVAYLGVGPTAVAFTTWAYALARTRASVVAATTLVVPAIVVVLSWAMLGELPTTTVVIGGMLCVAGVAIARELVRLPARRSAAVVAACEEPCRA